MSDIKGATQDLVSFVCRVLDGVDELHKKIAHLVSLTYRVRDKTEELSEENTYLGRVWTEQAAMIRDLRKEVEELKARSRETAGVRLAVDITQAYSSQRRKLDPQVSDWHSAAAEDLAAEEARLAEADAMRRENGKKC